jgi:hypothetical protein
MRLMIVERKKWIQILQCEAVHTAQKQLLNPKTITRCPILIVRLSFQTADRMMDCCPVLLTWMFAEARIDG